MIIIIVRVAATIEGSTLMIGIIEIGVAEASAPPDPREANDAAAVPVAEPPPAESSAMKRPRGERIWHGRSDDGKLQHIERTRRGPRRRHAAGAELKSRERL